jgi:hypothetical protein
MDTQQLPAPPEVSAPKKKRWPWILGGVVVALFAIGLLNPTETETTPTTPTTTVPAATSSCIDATAASAKSSHASEMLTAGGQAATNGDAQSAASFVRLAAEDLHQIAVLTEADPAIAVPAEQAAAHFEASASALESGQLTLATEEMYAGGDSVEQATAAIGLTDAPVC